MYPHLFSDVIYAGFADGHVRIYRTKDHQPEMSIEIAAHVCHCPCVVTGFFALYDICTVLIVTIYYPLFIIEPKCPSKLPLMYVVSLSHTLST